MTNSGAANSGCFSGVLNLFLCGGNSTQQVHTPDHHIAEASHRRKFNLSSKKDEDIETKVPEASATPGVVAKLMGLDSLPNSSNWIPRGTFPDSVTRSKSVNFVDYLQDFDLSQARQHRRVRSSASFHEVPVALQGKKNQEFAVIYLDDDPNEHEIGSKLRIREVGFGEFKQGKKQRRKNREKSKERFSVKKEEEEHIKGKNRKISKLKNEPRRNPAKQNLKGNYHNGAKVLPLHEKNRFKNGGASSCSRSKAQEVTREKQKEVVDKPRVAKKKNRNQRTGKQIVPFCSSESTSPISVLDDFGIFHELHFSEESNPLEIKSKWNTSARLPLIHTLEEVEATIKKDHACLEFNRETEYYKELTVKLCKLTKREIEESDWTTKNVYYTESLGDICVEFERKILDLLLSEIVGELFAL